MASVHGLPLDDTPDPEDYRSGLKDTICTVPEDRQPPILDHVAPSQSNVARPFSEVNDAPERSLSLLSSQSLDTRRCTEPDPPPSATLPNTRDFSSSFLQRSLPNRYEVLIRPGKDSVTDDPLLLHTPYIVNTKHMALICIDCKHSVEPGSALGHIRKIHPYCRPPQMLVVRLNKTYPGLLAENKIPDDMEPIFGLAVPLEKYVVCARCRRGYLNVASWRSHPCGKPGVDLKGQPPHFASHVQTFFRGNRLAYFAVKTPGADGDGITIDDFQLFKSQYLHIDSEVNDEAAEPGDYRELNQFLSKEGWLAHVGGHSMSELSSLVSLPGSDSTLAPIANEVFILMSNIQSIIGNAGFHVRRLLGRRPS